MKISNLGFAFYRQYYKGIDYSVVESDKKALSQDDEIKIKKNKKLLSDRNQNIYDATLNGINPIKPIYPKDSKFITFNLETTYPGLLCGSGYAHESKIEGESKLGFYFDYTTGLPVIPGSSIKGVLRSAFKHENYIKDILQQNSPDSKYKDINVSDLETEIFEESKNNSVYDRDIFFDAIPESSTAISQHFLGPDFITPHKEDPLKNPIPLLFLKVLPQVVYRFEFSLSDIGAISREDKKSLFIQIILDLGLGAKTNVGYGQFEEDPELKRLREERKKAAAKLIKDQKKEEEEKIAAAEALRKKIEKEERIATEKELNEQNEKKLKKEKHLKALAEGIDPFLSKDKIIGDISSEVPAWVIRYHEKNIKKLTHPAIPDEYMEKFIQHIRTLRSNPKGLDLKAWEELYSPEPKKDIKYNDIYKVLIALIGKDNTNILISEGKEVTTK